MSCRLSGGEPTLHPDFFAILEAARRRPIKHLMVNTNGIRIANEPGFAERMNDYAPGFEVYLQWDSLRPAGVEGTARRRSIVRSPARAWSTSIGLACRPPW